MDTAVVGCREVVLRDMADTGEAAVEGVDHALGGCLGEEGAAKEEADGSIPCERYCM